MASCSSLLLLIFTTILLFLIPAINHRSFVRPQSWHLPRQAQSYAPPSSTVSNSAQPLVRVTSPALNSTTLSFSTGSSTSFSASKTTSGDSPLTSISNSTSIPQTVSKTTTSDSYLYVYVFSSFLQLNDFLTALLYLHRAARVALLHPLRRTFRIHTLLYPPVDPILQRCAVLFAERQ